jgi:hypothetical protein
MGCIPGCEDAQESAGADPCSTPAHRSPRPATCKDVHQPERKPRRLTAGSIKALPRHSGPHEKAPDGMTTSEALPVTGPMRAVLPRHKRRTTSQEKRVEMWSASALVHRYAKPLKLQRVSRNCYSCQVPDLLEHSVYPCTNAHRRFKQFSPHLSS